MLPRIKSVKPQDGYRILVDFDEGRRVVYDVSDDIKSIPAFEALRDVHGMFNSVDLDSSRTIVVWNDDIDLASDTIYEFGRSVD